MNRAKQFDDVLDGDELDVHKIRRLCFAGGIPSGEGRRAMVWRVLLSYLPECRKAWNDYLHNQRSMYDQFVNEIITHHQNTGCNDARTLSDNSNLRGKPLAEDNEFLFQLIDFHGI